MVNKLAKKKIYWANLPARAEANDREIQKDANVRYAIKNDITDKFFKELWIIAQPKSNQNVIVIFYGLQGSGKSYALIFIAEQLAKNLIQKLKIEHCHFTTAKILMGVKKSPKNTIHILDEKIKTSGIGSGTEQKQLDNLVATMRKKNLSLFFSAPQKVNVSAHFELQPYFMGASKPWTREMLENFKDHWVFTMCLVYDRTGREYGHVVTKAPNSKKFLEKYESKKDKFTDTMGEGGGSDRAILIDDIIKMLLKDEAFLKKFSRASKKLAKIHHVSKFSGGFGLSGKEQEMVVNLIDDEIRDNSELQIYIPTKKLKRMLKNQLKDDFS